MHYIFSTLTCDQLYTPYREGGADMPVPMTERAVLVRGGAGVANDRIVTPRGVMTSVTPEQMATLLEVPAFQDHVKGGFLIVSDSSGDPEKVAADMTGRDNSSPMVPQDLPEGQQPTIGEAKPVASHKRR